jgi:hypothetical protein
MSFVSRQILTAAGLNGLLDALDALQALGAMSYQGAWNADTNTPPLSSGVGVKGFYYTVAVAGSTEIDEVSDWLAGDKIAFNGTVWEKFDGGVNEVLSVAGLVGAISASALKAALSLVAADISNASEDGKAILTAENFAAIRTALGLVPGTEAGSLVQLDGEARLPAVDGSQLTGLSSGISDGAINTIAKIASGVRTGADDKVVTGASGADGELAAWNSDGDAVGAGVGAGSVYRAGGTDVPVADGGTGRSSQTPFAVLCGGASETDPQQSVAALGSAGQVLTSNGAAALPTFQDAAGGGLVLLNSGAISGAATLDIVLSSYTAYRGFLVELHNLLPASDQALYMRTSGNGGSSYDAGASDYRWYMRAGRAGSTGPFGAGDVADSEIRLTGSAYAAVESTAAYGGITASIQLMNPFVTSHYKRIISNAVYWGGADNDLVAADLIGARASTAVVDAIRLLFASGNIASGGWAIYGFK